MPQAVTASTVREVVETVPGLDLPAALTDSIIDGVAERKTALILTRMGLTELPTAGTVRRDFVDGVVLDLTVIGIKRYLKPDSEAMMKTLQEEEKLILRDVRLTEDSSPESGFRFEVVGGTEP